MKKHGIFIFLLLASLVVSLSLYTKFRLSFYIEKLSRDAAGSFDVIIEQLKKIPYDEKSARLSGMINAADGSGITALILMSERRSDSLENIYYSSSQIFALDKKLSGEIAARLRQHKNSGDKSDAVYLPYNGGFPYKIPVIIYSQEIDDITISAAYNAMPGYKNIVSITFENILIAALIITIFLLLYIRKISVSEKKTEGGIREAENFPAEDEMPDSSHIYILPQNSAESRLNTEACEAPSVETEPPSLNSAVMDLFSVIRKITPAEEISIYVNDVPRCFTRRFQLKDNSIIRIDGDDSISLSADDSILQGIKKVSHIEADDGKKLIIPVKSENSMAGIIEIISKTDITGAVTAKLLDITADKRAALTAFICAENIMEDPLTGLYTVHYMKQITDKAAHAAAPGNIYSLIYFSLFAEYDISENDRAAVVKTLAQPFTAMVPEGASAAVCPEGFMIYAPGMDLESAGIAAPEISAELARYRIKLPSGMTYEIKPATGIVTSDEYSYDPVSEAIYRAR
jgi:hypothetical protein